MIPDKPDSVPEDAFWSADENEWCLPETDDDGEYHGLVKWWRPDGTLCCATEFVHGAPHGTFERYHESGEVAREGEFVEGRLHGTNTFYRSSEETTEDFPRGLSEEVYRAEMDYEHGQVVAARCFDAEGRRCMEDGTSYPQTRPPGVPEPAHFRKRESNGQYRWVHGEVRDNEDGTISRLGLWRFWTPDGVLVVEESYDDGALHGTRKKYHPETANLVEESEWKGGQQHGRSRKWTPTGTLVDERNYVDGSEKGERLTRIDAEQVSDQGAVQVRGRFEEDTPVGSIEFLDDDGDIVAAVDTGRPSELESIQRVLGANSDLELLAAELEEAGEVGASMLAWSRAVGRQEADPRQLDERLSALAPPLTDQVAMERAWTAGQVVSNMRRFGGSVDKCVRTLFEAIRTGGDGRALLRRSAGVLDDMGEPEVALEIVNAAIALASENEVPELEYTRALICASLGDAESARAAVDAYDAHDPEGAVGIRAYIRALFPDWDFWPATDSRREHLERINELLDRKTAREAPDPQTYRLAIQKAATRLTAYRTRLIEVFGNQDWIVRSVEHLLEDGPVEVSLQDDYQGVGINHQVRQEWTRLTWLCYLAGLDEIALPETFQLREDHVALHLVAYARYAIIIGEDPVDLLGGLLAASDVADPEAHDELVERAVAHAYDSTWFGVRIANLDEIPDLRFLFADDTALLNVLVFFNDPETDLFDEG